MKKTSPPVAGTADNLRLDRQLCFPLYTASRLIMRLYQPLLEPLGLTYPQYVVLLILWEDAPCSVSHIGKRTLLNNRDFVLLAVGDDPIAGQQAVVIEHQMQLDDSLGAAELRPVEDRGAQLDGGGVDRQQLVLEAELVPDASLLGLTAGQLHHQVVEILEQCAGTMGIGIDQGGAFRRFRQPQMTQLAIAGGQPVGDVAQAVDRAQLAEQHRHQLAPTGKPLGVAFGSVLVDCDIEVRTWNQLQELRENAAYCGQGCVLFGRSSYRQTQPIRSMQPYLYIGLTAGNSGFGQEWVLMARLCGLIALGSGALSWTGYTVQLYIHIAAGGLLVIAVWSLAFQARSLAIGLALVAGAVGIFIPVMGLLQRQNLLGGFHWVLQWFHLTAGLGGIALAEILAKRLRLSTQTK